MTRAAVMTIKTKWVMTQIGHDPSLGHRPGSLTPNTNFLFVKNKNEKLKRRRSIVVFNLKKNSTKNG
jgi:hypothetical protein